MGGLFSCFEPDVISSSPQKVRLLPSTNYKPLPFKPLPSTKFKLFRLWQTTLTSDKYGSYNFVLNNKAFHVDVIREIVSRVNPISLPKLSLVNKAFHQLLTPAEHEGALILYGSDTELTEDMSKFYDCFNECLYSRKIGGEEPTFIRGLVPLSGKQRSGVPRRLRYLTIANAKLTNADDESADLNLNKLLSELNLLGLYLLNCSGEPPDWKKCLSIKFMDMRLCTWNHITRVVSPNDARIWVARFLTEDESQIFELRSKLLNSIVRKGDDDW